MKGSSQSRRSPFSCVSRSASAADQSLSNGSTLSSISYGCLLEPDGQNSQCLGNNQNLHRRIGILNELLVSAKRRKQWRQFPESHTHEQTQSRPPGRAPRLLRRRVELFGFIRGDLRLWPGISLITIFAPENCFLRILDCR